jgi:hypothetical protein
MVICISYAFNIRVCVLHVSTISSGHHQALANITQVIKTVGQIRIRILATDGYVAKNTCLYIRYISIIWCTVRYYGMLKNKIE